RSGGVWACARSVERECRRVSNVGASSMRCVFRTGKEIGPGSCPPHRHHAADGTGKPKANGMPIGAMGMRSPQVDAWHGGSRIRARAKEGRKCKLFEHVLQRGTEGCGESLRALGISCGLGTANCQYDRGNMDDVQTWQDPEMAILRFNLISPFKTKTCVIAIRGHATCSRRVWGCVLRFAFGEDVR